ncbi:MAG: XRE family transcriptional regulator, partial [Chloroflexota bacterium]|nr:XRE family transcriptional regulator [Chloroflexota bacterium]
MSLAVAQRGRRAAHRQASSAPIAAVASELQRVLGPSLATVTLGLRDPKAIRQWARGARQPRPAQETALRSAYQVVTMLSVVEEPDVVRAWFAGMNPELDDE